MSYMKRYLEDIAYKYQESHPDMDIEEVMEKLVKGELDDEMEEGE